MLALIVLIGSIATPRLNELFERQKLNGSANTLRLKWNRARLEAMKTGQAQVFQCQPETGNYVIKPLILQSDMTDVGAGATVLTTGGSLVETQESGFMIGADLSGDETQQLEEKITFVQCIVAGDMRAYSVAQESQTTGANVDVSTNNVSSQVIFYPDGSTSTAEVQIKNERGDVRAIQMRGLTGHSRVVDITNVATKVDE